ncbi:MAG TPA: hypothetical protein VIM79_20830 [Niastella sp.]
MATDTRNTIGSFDCKLGNRQLVSGNALLLSPSSTIQIFYLVPALFELYNYLFESDNNSPFSRIYLCVISS